MEQELAGLRLALGRPCIVQGLADDNRLFLAPNCENISKTKDVWEVFLSVSGLLINKHKYV